MECCRLLVHDSTYASPESQQQLCYRIVSLLAGQMERGHLLVCDSIYISPGLQHQLHHRIVSILAG